MPHEAGVMQILLHTFSFSPPLPPSPGWNKASLSVDASEENDGYSSSEDPMNSDPEDDMGKKLVSLTSKNLTPLDSFWPLSDTVSVDLSGSWEVHRGGGLWEDGTSGAVRKERRRGAADPRGRGGTVVSQSLMLCSHERFVFCFDIINPVCCSLQVCEEPPHQ